MAVVKSYAVGLGDMFHIKHGSDNFTIIDCQLFGDHKKWLVDELIAESKGKGVRRFISTHPDEDHIEGIEYLDAKMPINNFYVVKNSATKTDESDAFKHYCGLRDGEHAFHVSKGCSRKWMNQNDDERKSSGINILWPNTENQYFKDALKQANDGIAFNNISLVARYELTDSASFVWIGDLETQFMEDICDDIELSQTTLVFAPHHGRKTGKLPNKWLDKLKPKIIVLGEAESRHLHYYTGYKTLIQTTAHDITFCPDNKKIHCFSSNPNYGKRDWLDDDDQNDITTQRDRQYYIGTLNF